MKKTLAILLCFSSCALAEQPWPKELAKPKMVQVTIGHLPSGLRDVLLEAGDSDSGALEASDELHVCRVDLNGDGSDEFIVENRETGGSGGAAYDIYEKRGKNFVIIGDLQGGFYFTRRVGGYYQIVNESRAGGGHFTRSLMRYSRGKYRIVRIADYRMARDDEEAKGHPDDMIFVSEGDPKEFDH